MSMQGCIIGSGLGWRGKCEARNKDHGGTVGNTLGNLGKRQELGVRIMGRESEAGENVKIMDSRF